MVTPLIGIGSKVHWSGYEFELVRFITRAGSEGKTTFAVLQNPARTVEVPAKTLEKALLADKAAA